MAVVLGLSWTSLHVEAGASLIAAIWPADALIVAYILRRNLGLKQGLLVSLGAAACMAIANLSVGRAPVLAFGFPIANIVDITAAVLVMRGARMPMARPADYVRFLLGAVIGAPLMGAAAAATLAASQEPGGDVWGLFVRWLAAVAMGFAILLPFLLSIGPSWARIFTDRRRLVWSVACQLAVAAVSFYVFFVAPLPFMVLILPFVMMSVFINRDLGAAVSLATIALFSLTAALLGHSAVTQAAHTVGRDPLLVSQVTLALLVLTVQPVTAALARLDAAIAELDLRRGEAEAQSERKTKLLAHVSHEIRTPLSGVMTLAEMMRQGALGELTSRQRDFVGRIADSGAEIEALSRDLLDAAAIQAGKASLRKERVQVAAVIAAAVEASGFRTREHKAVVEIADGIAETLAVQADSGRLRQMLMNLIVNGAKYGGRPPVVRVDAKAAGRGAVRFTVSDNGPGVPAERRQQIFNAFERSGAEKTAIDGSGVGLALVRELAQLQNGQVGVEDGPLGGACFWIELPRALADAEAA